MVGFLKSSGKACDEFAGGLKAGAGMNVRFWKDI